MNSLTFHIISDETDAKALWDQFSPAKTIDDDWKFRDTWTESYAFPFHFIVGYDGDKAIGLLPLQQNTLKGLGPKLTKMDEPYLEFFGGIDTDDNDVLVLPGYEEYKPEFLKQIKTPAFLSSLKNEYRIEGGETEFYIDRFELDLTKFPTFDDFMQANLDGVSRQRLINRTNKIQRNYKVEVIDAKHEELDLLFDFSIKRFGDRSSFNRPDRRAIFKHLLERFEVDLFKITLDGKPAAMSFAFLYKGSYITLNIGYDYDIRDISKLLVVTQIQRAIEKGCTRFDAGQGENGWKSHFNFTRIPQYKLILNYTPKEEQV